MPVSEKMVVFMMKRLLNQGYNLYMDNWYSGLSCSGVYITVYWKALLMYNKCCRYNTAFLFSDADYLCAVSKLGLLLSV